MGIGAGLGVTAVLLRASLGWLCPPAVWGILGLLLLLNHQVSRTGLECECLKHLGVPTGVKCFLALRVDGVLETAHFISRDGKDLKKYHFEKGWIEC